jgi:hypothetical protein
MMQGVLNLKKSAYLIYLLCFLVYCGPKQADVERIIEDGVEVVFNHLEPYKIKGQPSYFTLEEELSNEKFLALWNNADPCLPEVADARERAAGLLMEGWSKPY